ncbi:hypothetical protein MSI_22750 [Treponema sp. JC4]|uniref:hypothetical protein n=1 Tax=Treponema sp. JC4 TaxID=1124982 RepID=UPI00025B059F|nr:hypothetical protein [Treponema sp. JC4]EID84247.1 hypothetical protein MSI_22750 [Treponema sp. JC4]
MCKNCGKPIPEGTIYRDSTCPSCGADLHSCINCKFYAPGSHYDCHETIEEPVRDKDRSNFCDFFKPAVIGTDAGLAGGTDKAQKARDAFNALFS